MSCDSVLQYPAAECSLDTDKERYVHCERSIPHPAMTFFLLHAPSYSCVEKLGIPPDTIEYVVKYSASSPYHPMAVRKGKEVFTIINYMSAKSSKSWVKSGIFANPDPQHCK
jgi:hypothetical protein